jgi:hypothetical protein
MPVSTIIRYSNAHLSFQPDGNAFGQPSGLHGIQSLTLDTAYNTEDISELGQLDKYATIENIPTITATIEKVFDGSTLVYHAATRGATGASLNARALNMKPVIMKVATFDFGHDAASGTPLAVAICSGMYIDSLAYRFPTEGQFTESVSLVGTSKIWATGAAAANHFTGQFASGYFGGPAGPDTAIQVERRERIDMTNSRWPTQIQGITGGGLNTDLGDKFAAHLSNVEVTANLGRRDLFELGRKKPFYKVAQTPIEILTDIEVITNEFMDNIQARDDGASNVVNQTIRVRTTNGVECYMGTSNTVNSVGWQSVDTGGNEFRMRVQYRTLNTLTVTHPVAGGDPAFFPYP